MADSNRPNWVEIVTLLTMILGGISMYFLVQRPQSLESKANQELASISARLEELRLEFASSRELYLARTSKSQAIKDILYVLNEISPSVEVVSSLNARTSSVRRLTVEYTNRGSKSAFINPVAISYLPIAPTRLTVNDDEAIFYDINGDVITKERDQSGATLSDTFAGALKPGVTKKMVYLLSVPSSLEGETNVHLVTEHRFRTPDSLAKLAELVLSDYYTTNEIHSLTTASSVDVNKL